MRRILPLFLILLVSAFVLAACGGEDDGSGSNGGGTGDTSSGTSGAFNVSITAQNSEFNKDELTVPPNRDIELEFRNQDASIPHNVAFYRARAAQESIYVGELFPGVATRTYEFTSPAAGEYFFRCDVHPDTMTGTLVVQQNVSATQTATPTASGTGSPQAAPALTDSDLKMERVSGLDQPTQMVFLSANDLLVTEKTGDVVRVRDGKVEGPVLELAANYADERGVLGITLHPQFEQNRYVYVYWTWTGEGTAPEGLFGPTSDDINKVPPLGNRVDRFTWDGSKLNFDRNILELPSRTTDLTLNRRRGNHDAGVIRFGPDGKLYAVIGDQNVRGPLQNIEDGQQLSGRDQLVGVVLRVNDDGSVPSDNPFADIGDPRAEIYVYGLRNSFGYDWDPRDGKFWLQTNGQASYDELGWYEPGDNLGWIQLMGPPSRFEDYKQREINTERKLDNPLYPPERLADSAEAAQDRLVMLPGAEYRAPVFAWRVAVAPAAMQFVRGPALGGDYDGNLLVGDVNTGSIYRFVPNASRDGFQFSGGLADGVNDNTAEDKVGEMKDSLLASGIPVATDIKNGPDGSIWIASAGLQSLIKITRR